VTNNDPFMSVMGRAFGSRDRQSEPVAPLDKVLKDLHVSERENADRDGVNGTVAPDHRHRLEKLLSDAREIEQRLEKEASEAALAESLRLDEKRARLAKLAEAEREAKELAQPLTAELEGAASYRARIDADVRAGEEKLAAAEDAIRELESRLAEAQRTAAQAKSQLAESQRRAQNVAQQAEQIAANAEESARRLAECREARAAAEAELREAEQTARNVTQAATALKEMRERLYSSGLQLS
jgi:chromosome segregation ATPase